MNDTIDIDMGNVHEFRPKAPKREASTAPLTVVHSYGKCQHQRVEVDEKLAEATCADCKERLNPMHVLIWLANEDRRLRERWAHMRASIDLMKAKTRCKCQHCGRMTAVPVGVSDWKISERAHEIARGEES